MARGSITRRARLWMPVLLCWVLALLLHSLNTGLANFRIFGAPVNVVLSVEALYLLFPLLYLRFAHGLPQVAVLGLLLDATSHHAFGVRLALYSVLLVAMLPLRVRLRRENPLHVAWLAALINLFLFSGLLVAAAWSGTPMTRALAAKATVDLLLSEIAVALLAYAWVEAQRYILLMVSHEDPAAHSIVR